MDYYMVKELNPTPGVSTFGGLDGAAYGDDKLDAMVDSQYKLHGRENVFGVVIPPMKYSDGVIRYDKDGEYGFNAIATTIGDFFEFYGIVHSDANGWGSVVHYTDPAGEDKVGTWWWRDLVGKDGIDYSWFTRIQAETGIVFCDVTEFFNIMVHVPVDTQKVYHGFDEFVAAVKEKFYR